MTWSVPFLLMLMRYYVAMAFSFVIHRSLLKRQHLYLSGRSLITRIGFGAGTRDVCSSSSVCLTLFVHQYVRTVSQGEAALAAVAVPTSLTTRLEFHRRLWLNFFVIRGVCCTMIKRQLKLYSPFRLRLTLLCS